MVAPRNPNQINIVIAVDVIRALSDKTLEDNIYIMDNSPFVGHKASTGQGSDYLTTSCMPGQVIQWIVHAIDLQTPISISNIIFIDDNKEDEHPNTEEHNNRPDLNVWTGIVPMTMIPNQNYHYRLKLQMGDGENSIYYIDTPALKQF